MKKNQAQHIYIHMTNSSLPNSLINKLNVFHISLIERRLNQSNLTLEQKVAVIDGIIDNLRSRETRGIIE